MTTKRVQPVPTQYSKIVIHGGTAYLAGLIAEDWDKDIKGQTTEIFAEIDSLLKSAGTDKSSLLSMTVYIKSFDDYAAFKEAYAEWIDHDQLPARATVRADLLDPKLKVEIQATAAIG